MKNGEDVEAEVNNWLDAVASDEKTLKAKGTKLPNFGRGYVDVREALSALDSAGVSDVLANLDSVEDADLGPDTNGLFVALPNGKFKVQLNRKLLATKSKADAIHVVRHELSHGVDYSTGWALSQHPWMETIVEADGAVTPVGEAAQELYDHYVNGGEMAEYLGYPLNREVNGELDAYDTQAELFAQVASQWMTPEGKRFITKNLPKTAAFMKEAFKYAGSSIRSSQSSRGSEETTGQTEKIAASKNVQTQEGKTLASRGSAFEVRPEIDYWWKGLIYKIKDATPKWLTGTQLVEQWGKAIPALSKHQDILNQMAAKGTELRKDGHKLLER